MFRSVESILSEPFTQYERVLTKQTEISKKDLTNEVNK